MSRRRTALAAALSLLPLGQSLLLGTLGITTATDIQKKTFINLLFAD